MSIERINTTLETSIYRQAKARGIKFSTALRVGCLSLLNPQANLAKIREYETQILEFSAGQMKMLQKINTLSAEVFLLKEAKKARKDPVFERIEAKI